MNRIAFQLGVVGILIACGCGPKPAPATSVEVKKNAALPPPVAVATHPTTPPADVPPPHAPPPHGSGGSAAPAKAPVGSGSATNAFADVYAKVTPTEWLQSMNEAVGVFSREQKRMPKDMQELLRNRYIRVIPPAPPGKKYEYNQTKQIIELVSK